MIECSFKDVRKILICLENNTENVPELIDEKKNDKQINSIFLITKKAYINGSEMDSMELLIVSVDFSTIFILKAIQQVASLPLLSFFRNYKDLCHG